ncbi:unnamed protein product [Brassica rapa subsp. trilocularis]
MRMEIGCFMQQDRRSKFRFKYTYQDTYQLSFSRRRKTSMSG